MRDFRAIEEGMTPESEPPIEPFFLIVADFDRRHFCVEGPMIDDGRWKRAAGRAREHERRVQCGPASSDRRSLSADYQKASGFGGVPLRANNSETSTPREFRP
jgi:hypothetical protein